MSTENQHVQQKKSADAVIERLKGALSIKSDAALGRYFGVERSTINSWRKRDAVPFKTLFAKCEHLREEWVMAGEGEMLKSEAGRQKPPVEQVADLLIQAIDVLKKVKESPTPSISSGSVEVPHFLHCIAAGIPADSTCRAETLSLPDALVRHPSDTYAVTVSGDSMIGAGIEEGDILIVDRAIEPDDQSIVIASINGEQTVKRLRIRIGVVSLAPENHKYKEMRITPEMDFQTLGVVMWVIRKAV